MNAVKQWMEITAVLVALYLILSHGKEFTQIISAAAGGYGTAVRNLQGR